MKLTNKMCKVIADLEYEIGSECYNPNSYDCWQDLDGCDFRYPINVPSKEGDYKKIRLNINTSGLIEPEDITAELVTYMKYRFGSNELYIGKGILNVLAYLEERYGIDFNELENNRNE